MILHRHTYDDIEVFHAPILTDEETAAVMAANPGHQLFEGITARSRLRERASELAMLAEIAGGHEFSLDHSDIGSPMLTIDGKPMGISISHSRSELAIAISPDSLAPIGIDIENLRAQLLRVTSRFLNPDEINVWTRSPERLLEAWSAKEAAFKAWSPGVSAFSAITLTLHSDGSVEASAPYQRPLMIDFIVSQAPLRCIALAHERRD